MSLLARRSETRALDSLVSILERERGGATFAGTVVTPETAMRHSAVWSCVNLIADVVSTLPIGQFRKADDGKTSIPVPASKLIREPSALVDPITWRRQALVSGLIRGNVYGIETKTGADGWPDTVELAHPDWVGAQQTKRMAPVDWYVNGKPLERERMRHLPAYTVPGIPVGLSPIDYMKQSIGLGLAVTEYGARWFGDGAHPSAVYKSKKRVDRDSATTIKERIKAAIVGREPLVLGDDMTYEQIQIPPESSQFLETIKANRADIASIYFPHMILSEGASMTYANVEARALDLLVFDLGPWIIRLEDWLSRMLPRAQYVKLNVNGLVRSSLLDRFNAHQIAIRNGWRNVNEAREIEDEAPLPDGQGDEYLWPPYRAFPIAADDPDADPSATK